MGACGRRFSLYTHNIDCTIREMSSYSDDPYSGDYNTVDTWKTLTLADLNLDSNATELDMFEKLSHHLDKWEGGVVNLGLVGYAKVKPKFTTVSFEKFKNLADFSGGTLEEYLDDCIADIFGNGSEFDTNCYLVADDELGHPYPYAGFKTLLEAKKEVFHSLDRTSCALDYWIIGGGKVYFCTGECVSRVNEKFENDGKYFCVPIYKYVGFAWCSE